MGVVPPWPNIALDAAYPTAIVSSVVTLATSVAAIACCARCAAIAASCVVLSVSICSFDALLAADSAAAYYRLISLATFRSIWY